MIEHDLKKGRKRGNHLEEEEILIGEWLLLPVSLLLNRKNSERSLKREKIFRSRKWEENVQTAEKESE